jgi:hypothetical protein
MSGTKETGEYKNLLQTAIELRHNCIAIHRESVHVCETLEGQTVWEGEVEVFDLTGNTEAEKCYAWSHREKGISGKVLNTDHLRLITVLGKRPVDSPQMAVRTAIFYDFQPIPGRDIFSKRT